ncbi:hypothetical protein FACS189468_0940 [Spirochaetia bacterium]|nr:hypothetical protein FACS189468_0940 [Spirochaetia bacterium]
MEINSAQNGGGTSQYEPCTLVLIREIELLERIVPLQVLVRKAVLNREWADFEMLMNTLGEIGGHIELLEAERERLFKALGLEEDNQDGFYALSSRLPERERLELTELYRRLKFQSLQIRLSNDTLMEYLNEARSAVAGFLEAVCPERKGRLYSPRGITLEADMRSVVLNRSF